MLILQEVAVLIKVEKATYLAKYGTVCGNFDNRISGVFLSVSQNSLSPLCLFVWIHSVPLFWP